MDHKRGRRQSFEKPFRERPARLMRPGKPPEDSFCGEQIMAVQQAARNASSPVRNQQAEQISLPRAQYMCIITPVMYGCPRVSTDGRSIEVQASQPAAAGREQIFRDVASAKARGVRLGRKPTVTRHQRREPLARLATGELQADIARSFSVSQSTILRLRPKEARP